MQHLKASDDVGYRGTLHEPHYECMTVILKSVEMVLAKGVYKLAALALPAHPTSYIEVKHHPAIPYSRSFPLY